MQRVRLSPASWLAWTGLALVACLAVPLVADATEPMMTVRSVDGDSTIYAVGRIQRITFAANTLTVAAYGRTDRYEVDQVAKIEFLWWAPAGVENPDGANGATRVLRLLSNRPNPFSLETRIAFDLSRPGHAELGIYSVDGRLIRTLLGGDLASGRQEVVWDGRDDGGRKVAGGAYFYRLSGPGVEGARRLILLP